MNKATESGADGAFGALPEIGRYVYRIRALRDSSAKFGPCEICGGHVTQIHYQVEGRVYEAGEVTHHECKNLFGHERCLIEARR